MFLGIDTSCYTTSVAVVGSDGTIVKDCRMLLQVKEGARGLQQSQAVWQHLNNIPQLFEEIAAELDLKLLRAVTVSAKPRPAEDSYLPVFQAGLGYAKTIAGILRLPLNLTSHQEGHLMAGVCPELLAKKNFLAIHLSGGTSELLKINVKDSPFGFAEEILGKTLDLHAGQFVDRVGVALGLPFPSGPELEKLSRSVSQPRVTIPSVTNNFDFSFSGPESSAQRMIAAGIDKAQIARAVELCLSNTLRKILERAIIATGINDVLLVGGVSGNQYIRKTLAAKLKPRRCMLYFAQPGLSSDNAVGTALIGRRMEKLTINVD
jgi:N6-L-threonylcarbamoyladenine synthase